MGDYEKNAKQFWDANNAKLFYFFGHEKVFSFWCLSKTWSKMHFISPIFICGIHSEGTNYIFYIQIYTM